MKRKDILVIIILFFIVSIVWIGSEIYRSAVKSTISEETAKDISPIAPVFDTKTIDKLKKRQKIVASFELENTAPIPTNIPPVTPALEQSEPVLPQGEPEIVSPQDASGEAKLLPIIP